VPDKLVFFPLIIDRWQSAMIALRAECANDKEFLELSGAYFNLLVWMYDTRNVIKDAAHVKRILGLSSIRTSVKVWSKLRPLFRRSCGGFTHKLVSEILNNRGRLKGLRDAKPLQVSPIDPDPDPDKEKDKKNPPAKANGSPILLQTYLANCKKENIKPIPDNDPVFRYAEESKIHPDWIRYCWYEFKDRHFESKKKYKNWKQSFRNCVRGDWYKMWGPDREGGGMILYKAGLMIQDRFKSNA